MILEYELHKTDFLAYYMYACSKSNTQEKNRFLSRIAIPLVYIVFAGYSMVELKKPILVVTLVIIAFVWFLFYPDYSKLRSQIHIEKEIEELETKFPLKVSLEINEKEIYFENQKIHSSQMVEIVETLDHYFINLFNHKHIIIPKKAIDDQDEILRLLESFETNHVDAINWRWNA
ncbi:YcxB family protein [Aureivirga sp. CE67]|uniref:YcxB family protein n=1 Tax=Aureivirga sp. CE67 TaxID=1788983 RepID=UPI0018CAF6BF|nr:YcxB family protein [Aureivirga sp. CE67]